MVPFFGQPACCSFNGFWMKRGQILNGPDLFNHRTKQETGGKQVTPPWNHFTNVQARCSRLVGPSACEAQPVRLALVGD